MLRKEATEDMTKEFKKIYGPLLNASIDARYRQRGFEVFFALLDGTNISDIIDVRPADRIQYVGMDGRRTGQWARTASSPTLSRVAYSTNWAPFNIKNWRLPHVGLRDKAGKICA